MSETLGDFADALGGGFGFVDPEDVTKASAAKTAAQEAFVRDRDARAAIYRTFNSDDGRRTLEWLCRVTIGRPVIPYEAIGQTTAEERMAHAHFREGENEMVRNIMLAIHQHERGEDDDPENNDGAGGL